MEIIPTIIHLFVYDIDECDIRVLLSELWSYNNLLEF